MFRSTTFTIVGIVTFLLLCAAIGIQLMELDAYGDLQPLIQKVTGKQETVSKKYTDKFEISSNKI